MHLDPISRAIFRFYAATALVGVHAWRQAMFALMKVSRRERVSSDASMHLAVQFSIEEQLLSRNVEQIRGGLVFKAHGLLYHSTLGSRVIKKAKQVCTLTP